MLHEEITKNIIGAAMAVNKIVFESFSSIRAIRVIRGLFRKTSRRGNLFDARRLSRHAPRRVRRL